jgi:uncharacterized FlgJ-related protein
MKREFHAKDAEGTHAKDAKKYQKIGIKKGFVCKTKPFLIGSNSFIFSQQNLLL